MEWLATATTATDVHPLSVWPWLLDHGSSASTPGSCPGHRVGKLRHGGTQGPSIRFNVPRSYCAQWTGSPCYLNHVSPFFKRKQPPTASSVSLVNLVNTRLSVFKSEMETKKNQPSESRLSKPNSSTPLVDSWTEWRAPLVKRNENDRAGVCRIKAWATNWQPADVLQQGICNFPRCGWSYGEYMDIPTNKPLMADVLVFEIDLSLAD